MAITHKAIANQFLRYGWSVAQLSSIHNIPYEKVEDIIRKAVEALL